MLLLWKPVSQHLDQETKQYIQTHGLHDRYVAIFLLSDDKPSQVYVWKKAKKAEKIGMYADIKLGKKWDIERVLEEIQTCNQDEKCLGIMVQLPLAQHLKTHQMRIMDTILPEKDIDGLGAINFGMSAFGVNDFLWATPKAVLEILKYYNMDDFLWKVVTIIWRSNLLWKPLTMECIKRGATVITCNSSTDRGFLKQILQSSDYIMAATGVKHVINKKILDDSPSSKLESKILVDIWRGMDESGSYGDMDRTYYEDKVKAITPVPWGVGPVTVSCLFHNIKEVK